MGKKIIFWLVFFILSGNCPVYPQHEHSMPDMKMASKPETRVDMPGMYGRYSMAREASGTSWQPDSTPFQGIHRMSKDWMLMFDGYADVIYDHQAGKRGGEKTFSSSMAMCMAQRELAKGTFGLRSMVSLDPLMGKNGYPLLLQTGETADGQTPLIDHQHPHDFFMELATAYSLSLDEESSFFVYFGLPGEPALGPPAFMHRFSGMDIPSAPITHHWLDSTHIIFGVGTLGYIWKNYKIEGSVFRGREPDQDRWDVESPKLDSYSTRVSFNPAKDWALQASYGYLDSPEQLEPNVDTRRVTASCIYNKSYKNANWQTTFAWGRNDNLPGRVLNGFMIESALRVKNTHTFFSRIERVDKDELFLEDDPLHGEKFTVNTLNLGYLYEFPAWRHMKWGIGNSLDINFVPDDLRSAYGHTPLSYMLFVRVRLD